MSYGEVVGQGGVGVFPGGAQQVGQVQVGPFVAQLWEGEDDCDEVCRARFKQVGQGAAPLGGLGEVDVVGAELFCQVGR